MLEEVCENAQSSFELDLRKMRKRAWITIVGSSSKEHSKRAVREEKVEEYHCFSRNIIGNSRKQLGGMQNFE
jgi:hypothetical protein